MDRKFFLKISVVLASFLSFVSASFAWFLYFDDVEFEGGQGYTAASYFHSGDGSSGNPYVINAPIHLYNLAWLQYLGEFNESTPKQYYFELADDIDMDGWVLPPIGTTKFPFIGCFDGKGYTIENLTVSNAIGSGDIERKPLRVEEAKFSDVEIVGFFGVVGDYNGAGTYSSFTPSVENVVLDGSVIKSKTAKSLAGVAAGYVNGKLSAVSVNNSTLDIQANTKAIEPTSLTTNLSDYSLIGYATEKYRNTYNKCDTTIYSPIVETDSYVYEGNNGSSNGWGGSIAMSDVFTRLVTQRTNGTTVDGYFYENNTYKDGSKTYNVKNVTTTDYTNLAVKRYTFSKPDTGMETSIYFRTDGSNGDYGVGSTQGTSICYLFGGTKENTITTTYAGTSTAYYLSYTQNNAKHYLSIGYQATGPATIMDKTSKADATPWILSNANGNTTISAFLSGTQYYLANNNANLVLSTSPTTWTKTNGSYRYSISYNNRTYYLRYNNGWNLSTNTFTFDSPEATTSQSNPTTTEKMSYNNTTYPTYIPLTVNSDYSVASNNTGYITSGLYNSASKYGDVRVSKYAISSLSNSRNATNNYQNLEIATRTQSSGGFVRIQDDYNASTTNSRTTLATSFKTKTNYETLGLERYKKARKSLDNILRPNGTNASSVYGLHFMDSVISKDNIVVADYTMIEEQSRHNYQLPNDAIDFHLKEKGKINFFAGTYFSNNKNFFSLNDVFRDGNGSITDIKEIIKIYGDGKNNHGYIYEYTDGSFSKPYVIDVEKEGGVDIYQNASAGLPENGGYAQLFDTTWITAPTMVTNSLYYFEIPLNEGEHALGSSSKGTGAYLLYLDIAANAQEVMSTIVHEEFKTVTKTYVCPIGVALVAGPNNDDNNSIVAIAIDTSFNGTMALSISNNAAVYTTKSAGVTIGYIDEDTSLSDGSSNKKATAETEVTKITTRTTFFDVNQTTEEVTKTTITQETGSPIIREVTRYDSDGEIDLDVEESSYYLSTLYGSETPVQISNNSSVTQICNFKCVYLSPTKISISFDVLAEIDEDGKYHSVTGYSATVDITDGEGPVTIKVIEVGGTYEIYINDSELVTAVEAGTEISIPDAQP